MFKNIFEKDANSGPPVAAIGAAGGDVLSGNMHTRAYTEIHARLNIIICIIIFNVLLMDTGQFLCYRMTEASHVKVALFGVGAIGSVHLRHLVVSPCAEVTWIVEQDIVRAHAQICRYNLNGRVKVARVTEADQVYQDRE